MIQGFRPTRWLACAALAAAALAPTAPALAFTLAPAWHLGPAAPRASAPAPDDTPQELAGSAAGVGRDRPGRPVGEPANPELVAAPARCRSGRAPSRRNRRGPSRPRPRRSARWAPSRTNGPPIWPRT